MTCHTCGGTGCIEHRLDNDIGTYFESCPNCDCGEVESFVIPAQEFDDDFEDDDYGYYLGEPDEPTEGDLFEFHDFE